MVSFAQTASIADMSNVDTLLYTVSSMEILIPTYTISPISSDICQSDSDWFNGIWDTQSGINYCKWYQEFQGINWQYQNGAFLLIKKATNNILDKLWAQYENVTALKVFDFDIIISALKGILKDPQLLSPLAMNKVVTLFAKCSTLENFKAIALLDYSVTNYLITAERILGKIYFEKKMMKFGTSSIRYSGANNQEAANLNKVLLADLAVFAKQTQDSIIVFIKQLMLQLDTTNNKYVYIGSYAFEFKLSAGYPPDFENNTFYIRNSDIFWEIPIGLFSQFKNVASYVQQIYIMAIKWIANPIMINGQTITQIGVNMTTFTVFDGEGNELPVSNLTTPINTIFPYVKQTGYPQEFLRCQYYDGRSKVFKLNGCGQSFLDSVTLPWSSWAVDNSYVITSVFKCSCNHLSTISGVYMTNSISQRDSPKTGICLNFFAMNYWKQSFGYYLVWPSLWVYIVGMSIAIIIDCFTVSKMRRKILNRIILVGELNEIEQAAQEKLNGKENEVQIEENHKGNGKKNGMIEEVKQMNGEYENGENKVILMFLITCLERRTSNCKD